MAEYKEKHIINYKCGCKHEIGLPKGGGFWNSTGDKVDCPEHKVSQNSL